MFFEIRWKNYVHISVSANQPNELKISARKSNILHPYLLRNVIKKMGIQSIFGAISPP